MRRDLFAYRVVQIIRAVEKSSGMDEVDLGARELLWIVGAAEDSGSSPSVSDVIGEEGRSTAPTVYARIAKLVSAGWLQSAADEDDRRVKRLSLTSKSRRAFAAMSKRVSVELTPRRKTRS